MTAAQLAKLYQRRAVALEREKRRAGQDIARFALTRSKSIMEARIYGVPEDVTPTGHKKWERTRQLIAAERIDESRLPDAVLTNATVYAEARQNAPDKPWPTSLSPQRVVHWRKLTFEQVQPVAAARWATAVQDALRKP